MIMKKLTIAAAFFLNTLIALSQQDPVYTQYQFNQMIINPAYAGARDMLAVVALRRQQWAGLSGAPETNCLSIHGPVMKKNVGLGLTIINDKMGPRNVIAAYGNAAYILKLNEKLKLSFGISAGYNSYQFNFSRIELKSGQLNPDLSQTQSKGAFDINSGIYLRSKSFFVGISAMHLNSPEMYSYEPSNSQNGILYRLNTNLIVTIGKSFTINENIVFAPTALLRTLNGVTRADANLNFLLYKRLWLGAFYRSAIGPGGLIQFYITNNFRAGISYDTGLNSASRLGSGFEAMIGFDFNFRKPKTVDIRFL